MRKLIAAIREGMADGSVRSDVGAVDAVAIAMWGFMHGVIQIAATREGMLAHRNTSAAALYEQAMAMDHAQHRPAVNTAHRSPARIR